MYIIAGLGNPGEEYRETRHNTGRMALEYVRKQFDLPDWEENKKIKALVSEGKVGSGKSSQKIMLVEPETFMNKSGVSLVSLVKSKKAAESLVVIYDDLDLPVGRMKVSFNRSSGGHNGLESVIKSVKTEAFVRIRVGISPVTPAGKMKKPSGEKAVADFILGKFSPKEYEALKKVFKRVPDAVAMLISEGVEKAMGEFNQ